MERLWVDGLGALLPHRDTFSAGKKKRHLWKFSALAEQAAYYASSPVGNESLVQSSLHFKVNICLHCFDSPI